MSRSLITLLAQRHAGAGDGATRREVLAAAVAAGCGMLLSGGRTVRADGRRRGGRVVVVGGGFAGLAAAYELLSVGYDVTLVEARRRVGGRVLSFRDLVPGRTVEGGGELIGRNHPTWLAYASRFRLQLLDVTEDEDVEFPIVLGDKHLSRDESDALWGVLGDALNRMNGDAAKVDADRPWDAEGAQELDRRSVAAWIGEQAFPEDLRRVVEVVLASNNGQATSQQSYLAQLAQVKGGGLERYWLDSEAFRCRGGNDQLAARLAAEIGPARLVTGTTVTGVRRAEDRAWVTLAGGRTLDADDVVLALPPSVWRAVKFDPPLPDVLKPQMGSNVKFLMAVRDRFWRCAGAAPDSLGDGDVSQTWDGTDGQGPGPACLTGYSGGPAADDARAHAPEVRERRLLDGMLKRYPTLARALCRTRFMDWPGDPQTQGGFSFPRPGQVTSVGPMLREGLGRLHFAGEHCSNAFVGYMEGALQSGVAVARRIAERDGVAVR